MKANGKWKMAEGKWRNKEIWKNKPLSVLLEA